jgi:antitoxin ParD1/3/4
MLRDGLRETYFEKTVRHDIVRTDEVTMSSVNISLPDSLRLFVERRIEEQGYETISDYLRELILRDQKRESEAKLEGLLLEGLNSGDPIEVTSEYIGAKLQRLVEQHANQGKAR